MKHAAKLPSRAGASSTSSGISPHRLSHAIAMQAPPRKVRIVHVLAPEIIKTEARHFREVVQRLTGKPAAAASPEYASSYSPPGSCDTASEEEGPGAGSSVAAIKAEVKEAETSSLGGGYLRALGAEDGSNESFFQGLEDLLFSSSCNSMDGFSF